MSSSLRYEFLPFDTSYRLDSASSNYCGYINDITSGLVSVINVYNIQYVASFNFGRQSTALVSRAASDVIPVIASLPSPLSNDVRLLTAALSNRYVLSSTTDTSLALGSILKFMAVDVSASLYPTYWAEQSILSSQLLSYVNYRVAITSTAIYGSFLDSFDVSAGLGYTASDLSLTTNTTSGARLINYLGLSIRQLLKTWLRWSDTSLLSGGWYSTILSDTVSHAIIGVQQRFTDAVTWITRVEAAHNKVCYGAILTVGDDLVRYTGLAYEVQAVSASLLVYVAAIWYSAVRAGSID
jgi:hypothetical protein